MSVEKYFKKELEEVVFINLKEDFFDNQKDLQFLRQIPIPVSLSKVSKDAKDKKSDNSISPVAAAEAMIYIIGADANFPYGKEYMTFLEKSIKTPYLFILGMAIQKAEAEEYLKAAILFRAADRFDRWSRTRGPVAPMNEDPRKPVTPDALFNYAKACRDIYMESEDTAEKNTFREASLKAFEKLTEEFPSFDQSYYFLGYFYMNKKEYIKAKKVWDTFLDLTQEDGMKDDVLERMVQLEDMMIYESGYLEILNDRSEEGLAILLPLYEKYREWWNLLFFIGLAYRKLGEPQEAIPFFKEVARIKPSQSDALNELGLCYAATEDNENAEKYFKKAILIDANDPELLCNLAALYINWGRLSEAESYLLKAEEMSPDEALIKLWRSELEKRLKE